jgi:cell division protein ZapA
MGLSMKNKNDVEVLINGRRYTICGFESADYLQKVATYINSKYTEFQSKDYYYSLDMDLRNILLAINIADDYFKADKELKALQEDNERKDKMVLDMKHEVLEKKSSADMISQKKEELREELQVAEKQLVALNVKNQDNASKAAGLEEKLRKAESENSANAAKLESALERSSKLESENSRLKKKNETLNDKVKVLENEKNESANPEDMEKLESENQELKAKLEAAERRIADLEKKGRKGKR